MKMVEKWRISSFSGGQDGDNCVMVRGTLDAFQDSKNQGVVLLVPDTRVLFRYTKTGQFDLPAS